MAPGLSPLYARRPGAGRRLLGKPQRHRAGRRAPTHFHNTADEVIIVLDGALEMWIGDERRVVAADHTVSLPAGVPHGFVALGPGPARILAFLPQSGEAVATTYVEGGPPLSASRR
jgi:mannose-6-phosphate isomerase-like protein (cupin superfamily)